MKLFLRGIVLALISLEGFNTLASNLDLRNQDTSEFFVNSSGSDKYNCRSRNESCKTIKYAVERVVQSNVTSASINVFPGIYPSETVKIDCTVGNLKNVTIRGLGENVIIGLSADIVKCNVMFANVNWKMASKPILINAIISGLTIFNSSISEVAFSLLSSGSNLEFINCLVTNCSGWQPLFPLISTSGLAGFDTKFSLQNSHFSYNKAPLISAKVVSLVIIKKCYFLSNIVNKGQMLITLAGSRGFMDNTTMMKNTGGIVNVIEGSFVNLTTTVFTGNDVLDSTLVNVGQGVSLRASRCLFVTSYGTSKGPVMVAGKDVQAAYLKSCYFSCNKMNDSSHVSPIKNNAAVGVVNCTNCTMDYHCPVFCGRGEYLVEGVMCMSCPVGTYHSGSDYNITSFACKKCDPGYYNSKIGSSTCKPCKPGSFAAKSGSFMCSPCRNDFMTSDEGAASCSRLTLGTTILTICVVGLILFPLVILLIQYLQTPKKRSTDQQKDFKRFHDTASRSSLGTSSSFDNVAVNT